MQPSKTATYSGTTTVSAGQLIDNTGSLNNTSQVIINGGSLLFGAGHTGTIGSSSAATVNLNSGGTLGFTTHAAGTSLTGLGALTLASAPPAF